MSVVAPTLVIFILYKDQTYELVTAESLEDIAEFVIELFDEIERICEIDTY